MEIGRIGTIGYGTGAQKKLERELASRNIRLTTSEDADAWVLLPELKVADFALVERLGKTDRPIFSVGTSPAISHYLTECHNWAGLLVLVEAYLFYKYQQRQRETMEVLYARADAVA